MPARLISMAWKRSRVQFPLAPRDAAGQRPAVFPFSVLTLSGSNARAPTPSSTRPCLGKRGRRHSPAPPRGVDRPIRLVLRPGVILGSRDWGVGLRLQPPTHVACCGRSATARYRNWGSGCPMNRAIHHTRHSAFQNGWNHRRTNHRRRRRTCWTSSETSYHCGSASCRPRHHCRSHL